MRIDKFAIFEYSWYLRLFLKGYEWSLNCQNLTLIIENATIIWLNFQRSLKKLNQNLNIACSHLGLVNIIKRP